MMPVRAATFKDVENTVGLNTVGLLDQGAPMVIEYFVLATQMKLYNILASIISIEFPKKMVLLD